VTGLAAGFAPGLDPAVVDRAAPRTCGLAPGLDERLEPLEIAADSPLDDAERVTGLLDEPFRLDIELEVDARPVRPK
jgi:hypothetical protein